MLKKLSKYLLKLKDATDVRETILKDFYLKDLATMQRGNNDLGGRLFDTHEIKASILKTRDNQRHHSMKPAVLSGHPRDIIPHHNGDQLDSVSSSEDSSQSDDDDDLGLGKVGPISSQYQKRFGEKPPAQEEEERKSIEGPPVQMYSFKDEGGVTPKFSNAIL
jgi:hypothetical protein